MVRRAENIAQFLRLQLGRREVGRADGAGERATIRRDLEGVAIDHADAHALIDKQVALVDVAHDDVRGMERLERGGGVTCGKDHVVPADFGEVAAAVRGAIELVELLGVVHPNHEDAAGLAAGRIVKDRSRPGGDCFERARPDGDHGLQLGDLVFVERTLVIDLSHQRRIALHFVNSTLAPSADQVANGHRSTD